MSIFTKILPKRAVIVIVVAAAGIAGALFHYRQARPQATLPPVSAPRVPAPIGGQKAAHGCLVAAGYSWCDAKQACIRPWEQYCTSAAPKEATFKCDGGRSIDAIFYPTDDKYVDLTLSDGRVLTVPHAISADGARYAKADDSFVFWNKGDTAFITENGATTYANCVTGR